MRKLKNFRLEKCDLFRNKKDLGVEVLYTRNVTDMHFEFSQWVRHLDTDCVKKKDTAHAHKKVGHGLTK